MIFKDYYKILGLESCKVTNEEIRVAYREQAKKYHPDVIGRDNFSEERFKDINEAYKVLSNITTRKKYDRMWNMHVGRRKINLDDKKKKASFSGDIMNMFFGVGEMSTTSKKVTEAIEPIRGEDVETQIDVSIYEAFFGMEKKISLRTINGKMKTFTVKIPAGIDDGQTVVLRGEGEPGEQGGPKGDLYINVHVKKHSIYTRSGDNVLCDIPITFTQATLGADLKIPMVDGKQEIYRIPDGTQSGTRFTIRNKGFKSINGNSYGDFVFTVQVQAVSYTHLTLPTNSRV